MCKSLPSSVVYEIKCVSKLNSPIFPNVETTLERSESYMIKVTPLVGGEAGFV